MKAQLPLLLRVFVLYPLAGILAAMPSVDFDKVAGTLTIDVNGLSMAAGLAIYGAVNGGTFVWSRLLKSSGGVT